MRLLRMSVHDGGENEGREQRGPGENKLNKEQALSEYVLEYPCSGYPMR